MTARRKPDGIRLAEDLALPVDVVTQVIAILAKRRAGKSYLARKFAEQLYRAGQQIVIVDPKGDWWGLLSSRDGKGPGLPIVIFGGEHGHVPLESSSGELVARLIVHERISALLDTSLMRKRERATFMADYLEALYRLKAHEQYRTALMLILDEADETAPQSTGKRGGGERGGSIERMLGAVEDVVRRGGQRGLGCMMVTQRSAVLNKNVLTQSQILIALRTISPQDLDAMNAWIDVHGSAEERKTLKASLPSLPVGDAWVWSPGWPTDTGIFQRIHTAPIETYDSFATPKPGEKRRLPKTVADVDLEAVRAQMAETLETYKDNDPKELKRRIVELEKALARKSTVAPTPAKQPIKVEVRTVPAVTEAQMKRIEALQARAAASVTALQEAATELQRAATAAMRAQIDVSKPVPGNAPPNRPAPLQRAALAAAKGVFGPIAMSITNGASADDLPKGERVMLAAIAQYANGVPRDTLTLLTGYKRSTRNLYLQHLFARAAIEEAELGGLFVTDAGIAALGPNFERLPTGDALMQYWLKRLPAGERAILAEAASFYPDAVGREVLGVAAGYKRSTRNLYIQHLIARRILTDERPGFVKVDALLFD